MSATAIVLAAGVGRRMGRDKALLDLGGRLSIQRVVAACLDGGAESVIVVRGASDARLPADVTDRAAVVRIARTEEMIASLRVALRRGSPEPTAVLVFPVDYALVDAPVVAALLRSLAEGAAKVALPLHADRPGHPVALVGELVPEVLEAAPLREVVARDRSRVTAVPVASEWVLRDLDTPEDLAAARSWLAEGGGSPRARE